MKIPKIIVLVGILLSTLSISHTSYAEILFSDVNEKNPHYTEIKYLYDLGVVDTTLSSFYGIDSDAERVDVIVMIGKALGLDGTKRKTSFKDVPMNHYASGYIQSAVDAGIVSGYTDGTFKPNVKLNRGHLSIFIARAFRQYLPNGSHLKFKDVGPNHTAYESVKKIAAANITVGYRDSTFKPEITLSMKHFTVFMYRTMQFLEKQGVAIPVGSSPDNTVINSRADLQAYLRENYTVKQTKLIDVNFDITVSENDSKSTHYDYYVELGFNSTEFEQTMNAHLDSIKYATTAKQDVALAREQLKSFLEKMALDITRKVPGKKILGQNYDSGYRYPALKLGKYYKKDYSWSNYQPSQMENQWIDEPDDYWEVMSGSQDPSDPKVIQYSKDNSARNNYIWEYTVLNYDDFKITEFGWRTYLDKVYYDRDYY